VRFEVQGPHEGVGDRPAGLLAGGVQHGLAGRARLVVVPRMAASRTAQVRSGGPAHLPLIKLKRRCSLGSTSRTRSERLENPALIGFRSVGGGKDRA
jgi:hypothetical protein